MKIFDQLLDEGTEVWRPVEAVHIQNDLYRIVEVNQKPHDECWQFQTDSVVGASPSGRPRAVESW